MKKLELQVSFVTPAFLGNAEQQGQWRTPPFKTLLRQWWRVVVAKDCNYDVETLRQREAELFGSAAGEENTGQSKVRLRLGHWNKGTLSQWPKRGFRRIDDQVSSDVYLGFGPVAPPSRKQNIRDIHLSHSPAIEVQTETNTLTIGFDKKCSLQQIKEVKQALQFIAWFGTLGGRSNNGWGSLHITGEGIESCCPPSTGLSAHALSLDDCLKCDWSHSFARDEEGLLLWTEPVASWQKAVDRLGLLRKESRKAVKHLQGPGVYGTHLLGYPVMRPLAQAWNKDARLANQLHFKVLQSADGFILCVTHLPCTVPDVVWKNNQQPSRDWVAHNQNAVWHAVHRMLDDRINRIGDAT